MSTDGASSNGHKDEPAPRRDLRDRPLFRIAVLLAVLVVALHLDEELLEAAERRQPGRGSRDRDASTIDFEPDDYQVALPAAGRPTGLLLGRELLHDEARMARSTTRKSSLVNATTGEVKRLTDV